MLNLAITMGCPVGIGPEIIVRLLHLSQPDDELRPVIVGDLGVLAKAAALLGLDPPLVAWQPQTTLPDRGFPVVEVSRLDSQALCWGRPDVTTGGASAHYLETALQLIADGLVEGVVTCPISKHSWRQAGYPYPGHTEMLASLTASRDYAMMLAGDRLRVVPATIHVALREVADRLSSDGLLRLLQTIDAALRNDFGIPTPRIAVAGLNPHAGENGLFGSEESDLIAPAIIRAAAQGIGAAGPFPPDTIFHQAAGGAFDAVLAMYHDQGLIPFKLLHFADGVNVTLGLPIVRTSVDHGTAYDIAGQGVANADSLAAAVKLAALICRNRRARGGRG